MSEFHFLRPWLLLCLPLLVLLYVFIRQRLKAQHHKHNVIATHLLQALTPQQTLLDKFKPVDLVFVIALLTSLAAAGPSWQRDVDQSQKPAVVLVLKVNQSMLANDLSPTRLARAKQKIQDLLNYRSGAKTALVVYAQTSHRVLPLTEDNAVFLPFIEALSPSIMPGGDKLNADDLPDALVLAQQELEKAQQGAIVVLADDISTEHIESIQKLRQPFIWWQFSSPDGGLIVQENETLLSDNQGAALKVKPHKDIAKRLSELSLQKVENNQQDILAIDRQIQDHAKQSQQQQSDAPFRDMAWTFSWPVLLLVALWFRKGFTTAMANARTVSGLFCLSMLLALSYPQQAQAEIIDWFFTKDQQGLHAYQQREFVKAAELFEDPMWQGKALYEAGKYSQAAQVFATVRTNDALYNRANALFKAHSYEAAINTYQQVLASEPDYQAAQRNLALAQRAFEYLLEQGGNIDMEQSLSLDVDDKQLSESEDGEVQDFQAAESLAVDAKEQWMRSVDSKMKDFLEAKFANEAAEQEVSH